MVFRVGGLGIFGRIVSEVPMLEFSSYYSFKFLKRWFSSKSFGDDQIVHVAVFVSVSNIG